MKNWNMLVGKRQRGSLKLIAGSIILVLISFLTMGCGGSSGSSSDGSSLEGTFIDSPVQGLDYSSATHSGVTDKDGHFIYQDGEIMTFAMGDVILGEATAGKVMTPMDFIDKSERPFDETNPVVTNMGRFLQSLDTDGNPKNGITLSTDVKAEVSGRMINFHQSIHDFENDPDVMALFATMNGLNMPHNGMMWGLVTVGSAQQHMNDDMGKYMDKYMNNSNMGSGTGSNMK